MIPALGAGGREFESRIAPILGFGGFRAALSAVGGSLPASDALLAQMVERKTFNLVAVGSIPTEGVLMHILCRHSIVVIAPAS